MIMKERATTKKRGTVCEREIVKERGRERGWGGRMGGVGLLCIATSYHTHTHTHTHTHIENESGRHEERGREGEGECARGGKRC